MATTVVTIANLALSHVGDRANLTSIDPPEGSAQAEVVAQFWPIARDEALSMHDWGFARATASLAQLAPNLVGNQWMFGYARPADFLVAREMALPDQSVLRLFPGNPHFEEGTLVDGTPILFTNDEAASLRYTRRVTDPSRYPPKFITGLSYLLASYLAGTIVKGRSGVQLAEVSRQRAEKILNEAATIDANQSHGKPDFKPSALRARGYGAGSEYHEIGQFRYHLPYWAR